MEYNMNKITATETRIIYKASSIPDVSFRPFQLECAGDVRSRCWQEYEHLLRILVNLTPQSASLAFIMTYNPRPADGDIQSRLGLYLVAQALDPSTLDILNRILRNGILSRLYQLETSKDMPIDMEKLLAGCDIIRREEAIQPLLGKDQNELVHDYYYAISSFLPSVKNDYMHLDTVLGGLDEHATILFQAQPTSINKEFHSHSRYLSDLQRINRPWSEENENLYEAMVDDRDTNDSWPRAKKLIKPKHLSDPMADDIFRRQRQFHEILGLPHLQFRICFLTETRSIAHLLASVAAESALKDGNYRLIEYGQGDALLKDTLASCPNLTFNMPTHRPIVFARSELEDYEGLARLACTAPVEELVSLFRFPVPSIGSPICIHLKTDPDPLNPSESIVLGYDEIVQDLREQGTHTSPIGVPRGISLCRLKEHLFNAGMTGSGKTMALQSIVIQLYQHGINSLIIEPTKKEYRALKTLKNHNDENVRQYAINVRLYTGGDNRTSPIRLAPLYVPDGINRDEHIENILNCFMAGTPISGSMPMILGEALEQVYEDHCNSNNSPTLRQLVAILKKVIDSKGYTGEIKDNLDAILGIRLGAMTRRLMGKIFQCDLPIPNISTFFEYPSIIELDMMPEEQSCLLILFILNSIREYIKVLPWNKEGLRLVIILEEAHVILGNRSVNIQSEEIANPRGHATDFICRMLAECRAAGVGIIIADQLPSVIAPEVIKHTGSKLAFRQVDTVDRNILGGSMLMSEMEMDEIARFNPGDAYLHAPGYHRPRRIKTINMEDKYGKIIAPQDIDLIRILSEEPWWKCITQERINSESEIYINERDKYDMDNKDYHAQAIDHINRMNRAREQKNIKDRRTGLNDVIKTARSLINNIKKRRDTFYREIYQPLMLEDDVNILGDIYNVKNREVMDYENIYKLQPQKTIQILEDCIKQCKTTLGGKENEQ